MAQRINFITCSCPRCGAFSQCEIVNISNGSQGQVEGAFCCESCRQHFVFHCEPRTRSDDRLNFGYPPNSTIYTAIERDIELFGDRIDRTPDDLPMRILNLFQEACRCRRRGYFEASGAMFRKTIDVATKHIYNTDPRLSGQSPHSAARNRIKDMQKAGVVEAEVAELADISLLDGNDAVHDEDPYKPDEAEALEELTIDLLERLFTRPARAERVRKKQVATGMRKP